MSASDRELIVIPRAPDHLELAWGGSPSASLLSFLGSSGATAQPLFPAPVSLSPAQPSSFALPNVLHVAADDDALDGLAQQLQGRSDVDAAYVKPRSEARRISTVPNAVVPPTTSPSFTARQRYHDPAPDGVDLAAARARGGRGAGTTVIDLEWDWELQHEDKGAGQVGGGVPYGGTDHGTAVVGIINALDNAYGITGLAPDATVDMGAFSEPSATAIVKAASRLSAGDILLLEIHRPGPRHGFANRWDQLGYVAIEWWEDDFIAIEYATQRGIIVVEAAGNGAEDLDDTIYDTPAVGFPSSWTNPYRRSNRDCGAILVGAGAPPPGTHGRNHGPARSRLGFSNHGASLDAQGWGREVTTCGYGDLQGGHDRRRWYTDTFSGTSSASPIVVGVLALVQSMLRARRQALLTPATARALLRTTGSAQTGNTAERIGNLPDLAQICATLGL